MIICAAIKLNMKNEAQTELIIPGRRHGDCWVVISQLNDNWRGATRTEGFITDEGVFVDRRQAFISACQCGQLSQTTKWYKQDHNDFELYSEDLY